MKKFVVYTAIIGAYDEVMQPLVIDDDFDYILFSDCINEKKVGAWEIRPIDYTNSVQTKIARYVKTHPHTLLPEYECALWIDASVVVKSDYIYKRSKELYAGNVSIASLMHPDRDCIYDEAVAVVMYGFETESMVLKWLNVLHNDHYPEHNGLCETRILYRLQSEAVSRFNEQWWRCIDGYSRRDQLSFNYVLWNTNLSCPDIFLDGSHVRESEHISIKQHSCDKNKDAYSNSNKPALICVLEWFPQYETEIRNTYSRAFHSNCPRLIIAKEVMRLYPRYWVNSTYKCFKRKIKLLLGR